MTALQQYIKSYRLNNNIAKMINITEQTMIVETEYNKYLIEITKDHQYWSEGQIDNIVQYLQDRGIEIVNLVQNIK